MSISSLPATFAPPPERTVNDGPRAADAKRVLVLEDDPSFREAIEEFLIECGYEVTSVDSGVNGIQEMLDGDFAVLLCDMMMPGLPGDLFYRAVERARPELCERFVFMTGYRGDTRANDFIRSVNGTVLIKPFHLDELRNVIETMHGAAGLAAVGGRSRPAKAVVRPSKSRRHPPASAGAAVVEPKRSRLSPKVAACVGLLLLAALVVGGGKWYVGLRKRVASSSAERRALETRWTQLSGQVQDAEAARRGMEAAVARARRMDAVRNSPRWTPSLRTVVAAAEMGIELQNVQVRGEMDGTGARELQIDGVSTGTAPRMTADRFRQVLEAGLRAQSGQSPMTARFVRLEEVPDSSGALSGQPRAAFTIIAAADGKKPPGPEENKER